MQIASRRGWVLGNAPRLAMAVGLVAVGFWAFACESSGGGAGSVGDAGGVGDVGPAGDTAGRGDAAPGDTAATDTSAGDAADLGPDAAPPVRDECGRAPVTVPSRCTACHESPPTVAGHPQNARCHLCHGAVIDENYEAVDPMAHQNGVVDVELTCGSCHGQGTQSAPPPDLSDGCSPTSVGVGAHAAHAGQCAACHVVPATNDAAGHIDGDGRAEVVFSGLATADGAAPSWDGQKCANVYCHGATLTPGSLPEPRWTDASGAAGACGACHALADPQGNADADCHACHATSVDAAGQILPGGTHLDGVKN